MQWKDLTSLLAWCVSWSATRVALLKWQHDEALAALDAAIQGAELCKFGLGPSTARRDMDAYLASHAGLAGRVTTDTISEMFHWSNALIPTMLTSDGGKALAAMGAEEFAQALKPYEAERAKIEAPLLSEVLYGNGILLICWL